MRIRWLLPIVALVTMAAGPAMPPAPFSTVAKPGTVIEWETLDGSDTLRIEVTKIEGLTVYFKSDGQETKLYGLLADSYYETIPPKELPKLAKLWPLSVGKSVHYVRKGLDRSGRAWDTLDTIAVTGTEVLTVADGTFDTYIVDWESHDRNGDWTGQKRSWYAPEIGWTVKIRGESTDAPPYAWDVVRISEE
jgi:hypothetical protein